ncbi:MAG: N-6 DNA methylase [Verrucomicrobiota bacterium]
MRAVQIQSDSLELLRPVLSDRVSELKLKTLGQCFTGLRTGRILAALAGTPKGGSVVDPMAGHGDLLEAAAERAAKEKTKLELLGIEIERATAQLGKRRLSLISERYDNIHGAFFCEDAFSLKTWLTVAPQSQFELVITNPPYVRYQTQSNGGIEGKSNTPKADKVRNALTLLVKALAPVNERPVWEMMVQSYSGLADLSLPSWLLCGLLTKPGGTLAVVAPQAWLNRDYARLIRYFFLRFFEPLVVVQESGQRWFEEALVPVSLVIGRRLQTDEAALPLSERHDTDRQTHFIEITSNAASDVSHVGSAFPGRDPEGQFANWIQRGYAVKKTGIDAKTVSWVEQRDDIASLCRKARWFHAVEGKSQHSRIESTSTPSSIPPVIRSALPAGLISKFQYLDESAICVGQGLRTGCNDFFYVEIVEDSAQGREVLIRTSALFGRQEFRVPQSILKPVVRRQVEFSSQRVLLHAIKGRALDLQCHLLPEDFKLYAEAGKNGKPNSGRFHLMPDALAEYVRLASRTYLERGHRRTLIPELSAVEPNGSGPNDRSFHLNGSAKKSARWWYMIPPFTQRHFAPVFIPRIAHESPLPVFNTNPPALIDANFSTLWSTDKSFSGELILALFNSTWTELCMEALGTPLGGGALKLEATQIRRIPLPILTTAQKAELVSTVKVPLDSPSQNLSAVRQRIDKVVLFALSGGKIKGAQIADASRVLSELSGSLRRKRRITRVATTA